MELSDNAIDKLLLLSVKMDDILGRCHYFVKGYHIYQVDGATWTLVGYAVYRPTLREVVCEALARYAR